MRVELMSRSVWQRSWIGIGAGVLAALLLLRAGPAEAQACGDIESVPEEILEIFSLTLGGLVPLNASECAKIVKSGVSACHKGASESAQCTLAPIRSASKARKIGCNTLPRDSRAACIVPWENLVAELESAFETQENNAHAECDSEFATTLSQICLTAI